MCSPALVPVDNSRVTPQCLPIYSQFPRSLDRGFFPQISLHFPSPRRLRYNSHIRPNSLSGSNRYEITERFELLQQVAVSKKSWCELVLVREREQSVVAGTNGIDREISVRIRHAGLQQKRIAAQPEFRQQGESRALQGSILEILDDSRHRSSGIADRHF